MIVYAIIPARGGSVRIPHKNIVPLRGKPLIEYTIRCAQESKACERIIVSTDCCKTADIAESLGVQVVMRPAELSDGRKHPSEVARHCLESLPLPDAVLWLQPTSPLRKPEWIKDAIHTMDTMGCDSVVSYVDATESGRYLLVRSGDIYLTKTSVLLAGDVYGQDSRALIIPRDRYCNINQPVDLRIAEELL